MIPTNYRPFTFGRHMFSHNGYAVYFSKIRCPLSDLVEYEYFGDKKGTANLEHLETF